MSYSIVRMPRESYESEEPRVPPTGNFAIAKKYQLDKKYGWLVWYGDYKYPVKGILLTPDIMLDGDVVKKFIKSILKIASLHPFKRFFQVLDELCQGRIKPHWMKSEYYDPATREMLRAGLMAFGDAKVVEGTNAETIIKSIGFILSADRPYRYRLQDVLQEVNKKNWTPYEAYRLLKILAQRDGQRNWRGVGILAMIYLVVSHNARKRVKWFFQEINVEELYFDEADLYFFLQNDSGLVSYAVMGMSKEERQELYKKLA